MINRKILKTIIIIACSVVSIVAVVLSSSFFMMAAGKPATIYGPSLPPIFLKFIIAGTLIILGLAIFRRASKVIRLGAFAAWLVVLSVSTHRIVDVGWDGLTDFWLGVPVSTDLRSAEVDQEPHNCRIFLLPGVCFTRGRHPRYIPTILPFGRMSTDGHDHLVPLTTAANQTPEV